jgi:hypothetical protein
MKTPCSGARPALCSKHLSDMQIAYLPQGVPATRTTPDIDYVAVSKGLRCPWFPDCVRALEEEDMCYPAFSHGMDPVMADLHRKQKLIAYACARCNLITVCKKSCMLRCSFAVLSITA